MTLGKRCDEIVRLIDETLCELAVSGDAPPSPDADPAELEFPEDEPGRVQAHERLCVVGRPARRARRNVPKPVGADA